MAAATPSRPSVCIVPNEEVIALAMELEGLGGNDLALATAAVVDLATVNIAPLAQELAGWLASGFSATAVPLPADAAAALLSHVAGRLGGSLELALGWACVGPSRAADCLGAAVLLTGSGLHSAPAVHFSQLTDLQAILNTAFDANNYTQDIILSLWAFNPADSTLAGLHTVVSGRGAGQLLEMVSEVAELHARRRAGEHILRTSRLGLLNQLAAPLVAGNARLVVAVAGEGACPPGLAQRVPAIRAVCSKAQVPASELKWVGSADYLAAVEARATAAAEAAAAAKTPAPQQQHPSASQSTRASLESVERRRQQRERVSASLQKAAALGAARRAAAEAQGAAASPSTSGDKLAEQQQQQQRRLEVQVPSSVRQSHTTASAMPAAPTAVPTAAASTVDSLRQRLQQMSASGALFPSSSPSLSPTKPPPPQPAAPALSDFASHSGAVRYGSPSPLPQAYAHSPSHTQGSYAAAFQATHCPAHAIPTPASRSGPSRPADARESRTVPPTAAPPTAALQRRLWASSTAVPPVTDVFQSGAYSTAAPAYNDPKNDEYEDEVADELQYDLSEQAAGLARSAAVGRFDAAYAEPPSHLVRVNDSYKSYEYVTAGVGLNNGSLGESPRDDASGEEGPSPGSVLPSEGRDSVGKAALEADLAQERRVNAVLLRQLQEAQQRAAAASAVATVVPELESVPPGDFDAALAALQRERQRGMELAAAAAAAAEDRLALEVLLATAQREAAIARARARALERGTPLAAAFARSEEAAKAAQAAAERLEKENIELARALAEAEVAALIKSALSAADAEPTDTDAVIFTLHKRLQTAAVQEKRLRGEVSAAVQRAQAVEGEARAAEVNRRAAEEALKRCAALQAALAAAQREAEVQSLAAAEAWAMVEGLTAERDEAVAVAEAERERADQLVDLAEALELRARVGAAARLTIESSSGTAALPPSLQV